MINTSISGMALHRLTLNRKRERFLICVVVTTSFIAALSGSFLADTLFVHCDT
jgi:hypothetical protein